MGKINGCLKCVFIFFNVLFAILGCVMIYVAVRVTVNEMISSFGGPGSGWIWVIAISIFGVSFLGIFAACSERVLFLKLFAGFMVVGMIIMLIFGTVVAVFRNQLKSAFSSKSKEIISQIMDNEKSRQILLSLQEQAKCCGVGSAADWGTEIPSSCECKEGIGLDGKAQCGPKPAGSTGPDRIYSQSCDYIIFNITDLPLRVCIGFLFGFAVTALMGLLISLFMIRQVTHHSSMGTF
ncbi:PREDICTED: CD63 antigen-like [Cyprinodon variegatus]|uniref:Tetraspanin n=1 Tax=Cyprinodon variegatus TaxID=28743 RepID=A0A3Q2CAV8_CYPVA|nr:PREDICTED: CD63 antigen-like [Cyprinodon variegatus]